MGTLRISAGQAGRSSGSSSLAQQSNEKDSTIERQGARSSSEESPLRRKRASAGVSRGRRKRGREGDSDDSMDPEQRTRLQRFEQRKRQEEWRKARKLEMKHKQEEERERQEREKQEELEERLAERRAAAAAQRARELDENDLEHDDGRKRARLWGRLNKDERTILPKIAIQNGRNPGQMSDNELDARLQARLGRRADDKLMSEAEVTRMMR